MLFGKSATHDHKLLCQELVTRSKQANSGCVVCMLVYACVCARARAYVYACICEGVSERQPLSCLTCFSECMCEFAYASVHAHIGCYANMPTRVYTNLLS